MITRVTLADLKQKIAAASPPPLVVAAMDSRGTRFQLSTPRPTARVVGNVFSKADAECIAALWVWGQRLVETIEEFGDGGPIMEKGIPPQRKRAVLAAAAVADVNATPLNAVSVTTMKSKVGQASVVRRRHSPARVTGA